MKISKKQLYKIRLLGSSHINGSGSDSRALPWLVVPWLSAGDIAVNSCSQHMRRNDQDG